jgi:hypothetical protein
VQLAFHKMFRAGGPENFQQWLRAAGRVAKNQNRTAEKRNVKTRTLENHKGAAPKFVLTL